MDVIEQTAKLLRSNKWTLGFAESCTGGLLSSQLTQRAGVSDVFMGGVVTYSNALKQSLLGVREETLKQHGAVSLAVAREMSQGARLNLNVDWSLAITGVAGPSGGTPEKPVGTVCFSCSGPNFEEAVTQKFTGSRTEIQNQAANWAWNWLNKAIRTQTAS